MFQVTLGFACRAVQVPAVIGLITDLGAGEAEVLALALEHPGSTVILDDRFARGVARARNMRLTGTAAALIKAKHTGLISAVAPLLDELKKLNFRLSDSARAAILELAGE
jgi:predicted nucleic acid-binding protein